MLQITFALDVPRHPLNLLLRLTWTPELYPKLCRTVEQMLIARVAPVMSVMRLPEYRGGQWRFKGHVICFLQDIQPVVSVLPHVSIDDLVLRSQQSANADAVREFRASRQRVHDTLLWLMDHNRYYGGN